ncbi:heterokaryon incompatibility protein-domain-containing protein [Echria macrotheca]|uniref:Heterokaryon incompatibility protein-domain-containing protein n=1 Tax=Echria macrotheca TaxID=438768 RepID=A0AAJ0BBD8_9PEZI|nr:heterokaryon incompatibility protein-domain-containing protein [Echria macrotheca]
MRLLNTTTLELELWLSAIPEYAILSHTWGSEEVLFDDARHGRPHLEACGKNGLDKVLRSARLAKENGYQYIWIDTCCIDKSSSAELSEAINSMFAWYRDSRVCYAFLSDYTHGTDKLEDSRWFTRGWTLQELIAPPDVQFVDSTWILFGDRCNLASQIATITKIDVLLLRVKTEHLGGRIERSELVSSYSISARMSWAARRETTRIEDIAYSLLGIFDVSMPLLYGEGPKAFRRLQEQIVRQSNDQTILAWRDWPGVFRRPKAVFAPHPICFSDGQLFRPIPRLLSDFITTNHDSGIELDVHLGHEGRTDETGLKLARTAVLSCSRADDEFACVALLLEKTDKTAPIFQLRDIAPAVPGDHGGSRFCLAGLRDDPQPPSGTANSHLQVSLIIPAGEMTSMLKTRIILQEPNDQKRGSPDARFVLSQDLQRAGCKIIREFPDRDMPPWAAKIYGKPRHFMMSDYMAGKSRVASIYQSHSVWGGASLRRGIQDWFVIWGLRHGIATILPFCKTFEWSARTPRDIDGHDSAAWMERLMQMAAEQIESAMEMGLEARISGKPLASNHTDDNGSETALEAEIKVVKYFGRMVHEIEIKEQSRKPPKEHETGKERKQLKGKKFGLPISK